MRAAVEEPATPLGFVSFANRFTNTAYWHPDDLQGSSTCFQHPKLGCAEPLWFNGPINCGDA